MAYYGWGTDGVLSLVHNKRMLTQVVLRSRGGSTEVSLAERGSMPESPSEARAPRLGSQALVRLAGYAVGDAGYRLTNLRLVDTHFEPFAAEYEQELSDELVEILTSHGDREVLSALGDEFAGVTVIGIELHSKSSGRRIEIRRRGVVDTGSLEEAEALVTRAWAAVALG